MSNAHLLVLPALHPKSLYDGFRSRVCRCIAPRACHICIAQALKDDLISYRTKHEMKTKLHHTRIIMKHAGGLEGLLVAKRHAEHLAAEDGVDSTDDERDAGVAGTPTKSGAPQAPPRTPESRITGSLGAAAATAGSPLPLTSASPPAALPDGVPSRIDGPSAELLRKALAIARRKGDAAAEARIEEQLGLLENQ